VLPAIEYPDPTIFAIPFFAITLIGEAWLLARWRRGKDAASMKNVRGYDRRDTLASLALGLGSLVFVTFINLAIFKLSRFLFTHRLADLGAGALGYGVALIGWDLLYYWHHRAEHRIRILWACHVSHHSSQYFNLSTALRQPWTPLAGVLFYPWLALIGVRPELIMISGGLNLIYQYWVHTEVVGRMPAPIETIFNTPSHHRVHHGKNPEYIDKNYAGILILWDRLFGTFEPERAPVVYGLTHDIHRYNPLYVVCHEYAAVLCDAWRAPRLRDKLGYLFKGPGWLPAATRTFSQ
jgi:sterol desaturase/sphingolipid hydroxylase (fatty acid hydroxylase superfamily)